MQALISTIKEYNLHILSLSGLTTKVVSGNEE